MAQIIKCPYCNKSMWVPDHAVGKPVRCPSCKQVFTVKQAQGY